MILAVDQGTTGTTCLVVDDELEIRGRAYLELPQHFPRPGWVEHDPEEIWRSVVAASEQAVRAAGVGLIVAAARTARTSERDAMILVLAAALVITPILWIHYFVLLLLPLALTHPRLSPLWFVPLLAIVPSWLPASAISGRRRRDSSR